MHAMRWAASVAIVITTLLSPVGCNDETKDDSAKDDAKGAPVNRDTEEEVPGSPLDIPLITIAREVPVDDYRAELERRITEECGDGTLCLTVTVKAPVGPLPECQYYTTDPAPGTEVQRGSVVVIVTGTSPCEPVNSEGDGTDIDEPDDPDPGDGNENSDPGDGNEGPDQGDQPAEPAPEIS